MGLHRTGPVQVVSSSFQPVQAWWDGGLHVELRGLDGFVVYVYVYDMTNNRLDPRVRTPNGLREVAMEALDAML